jgi:hypothetical protein
VSTKHTLSSQLRGAVLMRWRAGGHSQEKISAIKKTELDKVKAEKKRRIDLKKTKEENRKKSTIVQKVRPPPARFGFAPLQHGGVGVWGEAYACLLKDCYHNSAD